MNLLVLNVDDGCPSISKDEARARVGAAVEEYRSGNTKKVPYAQGMDKIDNWLNNL